MSFLSLLGLRTASAAEIGDDAPALSATSDDGKTVNFSDYYKKGVTLVYFYPKADTPGCTAEACSLRDNFSSLQARGLQVIGVSEDKADAQKSFKDKFHLPFPLIADNDGKVAKAFGVPTLLGFAKRQSFLVKNGKIVWRELNVSPKTHVDEVTKALDALGKGA
jgi:thioredoxin-dependent peroxiredoxin